MYDFFFLHLCEFHFYMEMKISVNRDERLPTHRVKITREFSSQRCDLAYIAATILNYKVGHLPSNLRVDDQP